MQATRSSLTRLTNLPLIALISVCLISFAKPAQGDEPETVEIETKQGNFVVVPEEKEITAGQSIKWIPVSLPNVRHNLKAESPADAFEETGLFNVNNPATLSFTEPGEIKYFCTRHPKTMRGSIIVKPAN